MPAMTEVTATLNSRPTPEQVAGLRRRHPYQADLSYVSEVVEQQGWLHANTIYLETERARSEAAMRDLMRETGTDQVRSTEDAYGLLALAYEIFAPDDGFTGTISMRPDGTMQITAPDCPVFRAMEESGWLSVTSCPSWHRRRGWLDALGVQATDSVLSDKKWGTRACVSVIDVERVP